MNMAFGQNHGTKMRSCEDRGLPGGERSEPPEMGRSVGSLHLTTGTPAR